jgi:hypothetical protein
MRPKPDKPDKPDKAHRAASGVRNPKPDAPDDMKKWRPNRRNGRPNQRPKKGALERWGAFWQAARSEPAKPEEEGGDPKSRSQPETVNLEVGDRV